MNTGFRDLFVSFPLDGAGGFGSDVVDDAVDVFYFVCDTVGDFGKDIIWDLCPIRRHKIICCNGSDRD